MAGSNSDMEPGLDDFRRYRDGEMSSREAYLLEKRMLEEPMIAEAYEGYLALSEDNIDYQSAVTDLSKSLHDRVNADRRNVIPFLQYAAVASLIVGFGVGALVLVLDKNKKPDLAAVRHAAAPKQNEHSIEQPESLKITNPTTTAFQSAPQQGIVSQPEREISVAADHIQKADAKEDIIQSNVNEERIAAAEPVPAEAPLPVPQPAFATAARRQVLAQKLEDATDQGFADGFAAKANTNRPQPVGGWDSYRSYLAKHTESAREGGEVIVTFTVQTDSTISGFATKGSPILFEDAIRIIQNGPAWVPARNNSQFVVAQTTLTLKFQKTK